MGSKSKQPAARLGDIASNHGAWHPSPIIQGSGNVFTNSKPAARQGDAAAPHVKPKSPPHGRSIAEGSGSVFINGKPAARITDAIDCGGKVATGSGNVFIGDDPQLEEPTPPDTHIAKFKLFKTDNRPFIGYNYTVKTLGGKVLAKGKTDKMGATPLVDTEMSQRLRVTKSILPESELVTENWRGNLDSVMAKMKKLSSSEKGD
ncbi:MAG: PAAR domain-containing protein [Cellvibrionaceae bacterium]